MMMRWRMSDLDSKLAELPAVMAKVRQQSEKYSRFSGYPLNPDTEIVDTVIEGLSRNRLRYGFAYCPCVIVSGDREKDKALICPCEAHKRDLARIGTCHCALFVNPNFTANDSETANCPNGIRE
jgi:ferredoxin-thioredoxin reductase catalytic subunit